MKQTISALALVLALAAGCKKAEPPPRADPAPAGSAAVAVAAPDGSGMATPAGHHDEHENLTPELAKFHDLIKPLWHAPVSPQRMTDTCAAVPALQAQAAEVAKAAAPAGADAAKWAAATKELVDATAALQDPCAKKDATAFEPAFKRVHDGFHGAMGASGGMHE